MAAFVQTYWIPSTLYRLPVAVSPAAMPMLLVRYSEARVPVRVIMSTMERPRTWCGEQLHESSDGEFKLVPHPLHTLA